MQKEREKRIAEVRSVLDRIITETRKGFLGKPEIITLVVQAIAAGLHILIEDVAGVGKTTLIHCLAKATGLDYGRIQFTPDLLPGDITGMSIWDPVKHEFVFKEGPIRRQLLLADELNRAPARTQSALLEAMQEEAVTIDGKRYPLPSPFIVAATQNPFWYTGTYSLPESQLDRFGISLTPGYPDAETEALIIETYKNRNAADQVSCRITPDELLQVQRTVRAVPMEQTVSTYAVTIAEATRRSKRFQSGLSTRGLQHLIRLAQTHALFADRDFLIPEDLKSSAVPVMRHRLVLSPEARSEGRSVSDCIEQLLDTISIPIMR